MSQHLEKALDAVNRKIESNKKQKGFFVRHLWKVIGLGVLTSIAGPSQVQEDYFGRRGKNALELSGLEYVELVFAFAFFYTLACFIGHCVFSWQDKKALKALEKRKAQLEKALE